VCWTERKESIASLVHGLDESRHITIVTQRDAKAPNCGVQAVLEVDESPFRPQTAA
jgi:hypothetical protein